MKKGLIQILYFLLLCSCSNMNDTSINTSKNDNVSSISTFSNEKMEKSSYLTKKCRRRISPG